MPYNQKKQIASWINDFDILKNYLAKKEKGDGKASLIFGVGFDDKSWKSIINAKVPDKMKSNLTIFGKVSSIFCAGLIESHEP